MLPRGCGMNQGSRFKVDVYQCVCVCVSEGVLVYSHQEGVENGDFIVLNVVDERLQLRYNLGSGAANITYDMSTSIQ